MKITFSILCYNYGRFLARAIDSCLIQQIQEIETEILVIDDGSTDETSTVCSFYGDRIRVFRGENEGFASALTKAVRFASGDYVFLLDADDYFAPGKLEAFVPAMRGRKLFICDIGQMVDEEGNPISGISFGGGTSTIAIHRESASSLLPVENEIGFHPLNYLGSGHSLNKAFTYYTVHAKSMTNRVEAGKQQKYLARVTHHAADRVEGLSENLPGWLQSRAAALAIRNAMRARAYYNELEAALEMRKPISAWKACARMFLAAARGCDKVTIFHWKMLAKTIIMRPSFPK